MYIISLVIKSKCLANDVDHADGDGLIGVVVCKCWKGRVQLGVGVEDGLQSMMSMMYNFDTVVGLNVAKVRCVAVGLNMIAFKSMVLRFGIV